jgi:hypothetical protein
MKTHYWQRSKKLGDKGEALLLSTYPTVLGNAGGRVNDFYLLKDKKYQLEGKSDFYWMDTTDNYFWERFSSDYDYKDGGPWKAKANGASAFLYFFYNNKKIFVFKDIDKLLRRITKCLVKYQIDLRPVRNSRWDGSYYHTLGWPVPRHLFTDLCTEVNLGDPLPF